MIRTILNYALLFLLVWTSATYAQERTNVNLPNVVLNPAYFTSPTFFERQLGSIGGRVTVSTGIQGSDASGVPSVKVHLRSADKGFERFAREVVTNERGAYSFVDLPAGNYVVTVDHEDAKSGRRFAPHDVPANIFALERTIIDLILVPQRSIIGTVFIDRDRDLRYKEGTDELVPGALISYNGTISTTAQNGTYTLYDPPAGRVSFIVSAPHSICRTHVVLEIAEQSTKPRIVNVALSC